jgi:peptidyl-prolyl cis-trans isomerase A (cyclophilin A)
MVAKRKNITRKRSRPVTPKKIIPNLNIKIIGILIIIFIIIIFSATYLFLGSDSENNNNGNINDNPIAVFDTSMGLFKVELFEDKMPITCNNFIKLVNDGFYNGMIFYRISDDFMIQAGRFFADGSEDFSKYGNIDFEESNVKHVDGAISMASTGVKVGGSSEFFICDGEQALLDGNYAAFGITIEGINVVKNIASQQHDNSNPAGGGKPNTDIIINSITIE